MKQNALAQERRIEAILRAAEVILTTAGADRVTVGEVSKVALIPRALIYQHFADGREILGSLSAQQAELLVECLRRLPKRTGDDRAARIGTSIATIIRFAQREHVAYLLFAGPFGARDRDTEVLLVRTLAISITDDAVRRDPRPPLDREFAAAAAMACLRHAYATTGAVTAAAAAAAERLMHGAASLSSF